jgi:hypothetical protein
MKKLNMKIVFLLLVVTMFQFLGCNKKTELLADADDSYLPQDVKRSCIVSDTEFNTWFKSGKVTENGSVMPANSVTFPHGNNCDFYKWSEQMFLWITSPASANGGTVLESLVFYNVSSADANNKRTLTSHTANEPMKAEGNINQNGPNRLPIIIDKKGRMFEVESPKSNEKVIVENAVNKRVTVDHILTNAQGIHSFIDVEGKVIQKPKAIIKARINPSRIVSEIKVKGKSVFLDAAGNQIDAGVGQAGHNQGVLMAANKSLVYYITMVNDVYAYFLTGVNEGKLKGSQFPINAAARDSILAYAKTKGWAAPPDPNALAIELKTSWVEAKDLPNRNSYITMKAKIPTYDKSNPAKWIVKGDTIVTLALVGMHVVGSVAGHPEMIWATFEHKKNSPNAAYAYRDRNDKIKKVQADTNKGWLFNTNASDTTGGQNFRNMTAVGDTVTIINTATMYSPDTRRIMAWGSASNTVPNQEDKTPADANSEVIAINNAIQKMLVGNDIRKNYLFIGATWTFGGIAPNGKSYPYGVEKDTITHGAAIGTAQLANSTMETFMQSPTSASTSDNSRSCFYCHSHTDGANKAYSLKPKYLSHVFEGLQSLPSNLKRK